MNRSPYQSWDHEPAGAGVPLSIPFVVIGPLNRLVHTTLPITPALGAFIGPKQYNAMVGLEMASTAGTCHWVSTAPDGIGTTDVALSPHPRCLPRWSRALPTLQERGSAVGATTHLASTPSRQDAGYLQTTRTWLKIPLCDLNLCNTHSWPCITVFTVSLVSFWAHTYKSFLTIRCLLEQVPLRAAWWRRTKPILLRHFGNLPTA